MQTRQGKTTRQLRIELLETRQVNDAALGHLLTSGDFTPEPASVVSSPMAASSAPAETDLTAVTRPRTGSPIVAGILNDVAEKYGVPGLSAAVFLGGKTIAGAAGVRETGFETPVQLQDRFGSGSTTKAMTATLAGVLVEKQVLKWNSTIGKVFPEWKGVIQPQFLQVTLEQLLQHRGGVLADEDASPQLIEKVLAYRGSDDRIRLALGAEILKEASPEPVGTFRYSNAGYAIAAAMMEKATGVTYEKLMQKYVFNPLDMKSATFHPPGSKPGQPPVAPVGHNFSGEPLPEQDPAYAEYDLPLFYPAGARLRMNVSDWVKFAKLHTGEAEGAARIVSPATLARLHKAAPGAPLAEFGGLDIGYAMGWGTLPAGFGELHPAWGPSLTHDGSDGLWLTQIFIFPQSDRGILLMANTVVDRFGNDVGTAAFSEIRHRLASEFFPPQVSLSADGKTLRVQGTYADDRVKIVQDTAADKIVVVLDGQRQEFDSAGIEHLRVNLLTGADQITYRVTGPDREETIPISIASLDGFYARHIASDTWIV